MKEDELKSKLTPEQYAVLVEKGTETPYAGKYVHTKDKGMYHCTACDNQLFSSDTKFDAENGPVGLRGWPSFDRAIPGAVKFLPDNSAGMSRTEVVCVKCGSHLGHIFDDETAPSGKHFCINSVCLDLKSEK